MLLHIVLEKDGVNISERLRKGEILTIAEVDQLAKYCEINLAAIEVEVRGSNWTSMGQCASGRQLKKRWQVARDWVAQ
jgi:hypothetical protein